MLAQAAVAVVVFPLIWWRVRRQPHLRLLVIGLGVVTFALFALRAMH